MLRRPLPHRDNATTANCDSRLAAAALKYRVNYALLSDKYLNAFNITAWLYQEGSGVEKIKVGANTTIAELNMRFGPADTPDAEVGFHSEMLVAEELKRKTSIKVLEIFSERLPCPKMCSPMLRTYYPSVPVYYYYNRQSWVQGNKVLKFAGEILRVSYGL